MSSRTHRRVGVMFDRDVPPEQVVSLWRTLDHSAADDLWVVEDLEWTGSVASAATALAVTRNLRVAIGIAPAPYRNPAVLAMELATLARLYPDRLLAGIGHGVREWTERIGAIVPSPLSLLGETLSAVRALLHGESVSMNGRFVRLDNVRLVHPPTSPPPVVTGVVGPRSLELSGRLADGTILIEGTGPARVKEAWHHIRRGVNSSSIQGPHQVIVLTHLHIGAKAHRVAEITSPIIAEFAEFLGIDRKAVFMATGSADVAADRVTELWEAGASTVVLHPIGPHPDIQVELALEALASRRDS